MYKNRTHVKRLREKNGGSPPHWGLIPPIRGTKKRDSKSATCEKPIDAENRRKLYSLPLNVGQGSGSRPAEWGSKNNPEHNQRKKNNDNDNK